MVALGGCNAWNCMNSCEVYDPVNDSWNDLPSLAIARRGAGAAYLKGNTRNYLLLHYFLELKQMSRYWFLLLIICRNVICDRRK